MNRCSLPTLMNRCSLPTRRKVMLYSDPEHLQDPYCYIVIDYQRPEVGEMVHVKGINGNELYLAAIRSVDYNAATCYA